MESATNDMADNLSAAIMNQNDPETVRDGAPAYLLMLDSFIEGSPDNAAMLGAAAELYAAYGVIFVEDEQRADRLTTRALDYAENSLCASNKTACGANDLSFKEFEKVLESLQKKDTASLFTFGLASIAYIKVPDATTRLMSDLVDVIQSEVAFCKFDSAAPALTSSGLSLHILPSPFGSS